jgi:hypothetical protein
MLACALPWHGKCCVARSRWEGRLQAPGSKIASLCVARCHGGVVSSKQYVPPVNVTAVVIALRTMELVRTLPQAAIEATKLQPGPWWRARVARVMQEQAIASVCSRVRARAPPLRLCVVDATGR